jgi:predicted nucleotidyltransferase
MIVTTLTERKRKEAARRADAARSIMSELRGFAAVHGGKFLVFGSSARGGMRFTSDIDVLIDFPKTTEPEAFQFAERLCRKYDLVGDLHSMRTTKPEFVDRVSAYAKVLG